MPDINELVKQLGADQEPAYKAHKALLEQVTRATAPGAEAQKKELARALAEQLTAKTEEKRSEKKKEQKPAEPVHSPEVRAKIIRLLSYVAGDAELMALMGALRELDLREMARFALDFNPSTAATKMLIMALDEVGPEFRVGVVGALGRRGSPEALQTLQQLAAGDPEEAVRIAAVEELGNFPEPASDPIIQKAAQGPHRTRAMVARVRLADTLRRAGKGEEAARIYRSITSDSAEPQYKKAAEIGLKSIA